MTDTPIERDRPTVDPSSFLPDGFDDWLDQVVADDDMGHLPLMARNRAVDRLEIRTLKTRCDALEKRLDVLEKGPTQ